MLVNEDFHWSYGTITPVLRGHLWDKEKNGLLRQVTFSLKKVNSYEIFYDREKKKRGPFNTGDCLIMVNT